MTAQALPASRLSVMVVAGAFFLEVLDATIMTPALVAMASAMDTGLDATTISVAAYVLALALFTPLVGSLFPKITLKQKVLIGIVIFGVGSALCAISQNLYQLGASRMIQGLGSALMVPAGRTLILSQTPRAKIPATMAWLIWPALLAPIFGLMLGAHLVQHYHWRAVFYVLIVLAALLYLTALAWLPGMAQDGIIKPLDSKGYALWMCFCILLFGFFVAATSGSVVYAGLSLSSACLSLLLFCHSVHRRSPFGLFQASLMRHSGFRLNIISGSFFRIGIYAFPVVLTLYMLTSTALSPVAVGNYLAFIFIGNLLAKPIAVRLLNRHITGRLYFSLSALFTFFTYLPFLFIDLYNQPALLIAACLTHRIARSFQFLGYSSVAFLDVFQKDYLHANVLIGSVMQVNLMAGQTLPALFVVLVTAGGLFHNHHLAFLLLGVGSTALLAFCAFIDTTCRQL